MKTNALVLPHLAEFFSEREMFQTKVVKKIIAQILGSATFFLIVPFMRQCGKIL
jgi:uncharacterized protein YqfB (UPF0267 family)